MSESRLMYTAQRPANNRETAAKMAAAARRQRERIAAAARAPKHDPECWEPWNCAGCW